MLNEYLRLNGQTKFIIGYVYNNGVYIHFMDTLTSEFTKQDRASTKNGGGITLRLRVTKAMKKAMLASSIEICNITDLISDKYNRGEMLECEIYKFFNKIWHKDNKCFIDGGDININGIEYQIKFQNATIITKKTLNNILKRGF